MKSVGGSRHKVWDASPPSRAAWIEIAVLLSRGANNAVAAFTGGVD